MSVQANSKRVDPYRNFKFKVYFANKSDPVALVSKMSALKKTTEVAEWREGGEYNTVIKMIGKTKDDAITLEQGLSIDKDFEDWANLVNKFNDNVSAKDSQWRQDIRIEILDIDGKVVLKYKVLKCWPSEYQALPDFDANANAVAIKHLKIENEGWERED